MRGTISATLTPEAYRVYEIHARDRMASEFISRAMVESEARENLLKAISIQRDIYRARSGAFRRLSEEIDAGIYQEPELIMRQINRVFEKHPFAGEEQKTLEEF